MRPDRLAALLLAVTAAGPAAAQGLDGRAVLFRVETWDGGERVLASRDYAGRVGPGPEFDVAAEASGPLAVVPATIDLGPARLDLSFAGTPPGVFAPADFNGYVLSFPVECTLLVGAAIDPGATTLPIADAALTVEPQALRLDVAGLAHGPGDRIGITLAVTDCALS